MNPVLITYGFVFMHGVRKALGDRTELLGTIVFYIMVTLVFTMVYRVVPVAELGHPALTTAHLAWYVAMTQIIVLTAGNFANELHDDIQAGRFTTLMQRPKNTLLLKLADWAGQFMVYATILLGTAMVWMTFLTGTTPFHLVYLPLLLVALFLGALLYMVMMFTIDLTELWGRYARAAGWLSQKLLFLLGGLFCPPLFFPPAIQAVAWLTPFPAMLYVPGSLMLARPMTEIMLGLIIQLAWLGILIQAALAFYNRAVRRILREGD